ncbi:IPExxxVDY family protein [Gramella sp. GC03-9]|uniref:IPExxxVDY family protein n=1 Tax=Christiangramia oceanisediminis TaxID=2920386 RepID=A0A9X2KW88_9FLAO|nr:IPExxxVDY family protein [Gramella oceanisediminis]MCP9199198.1 IPExxxVDY family protein [Gramella oceanisediminis]
MQSHKVLLDVEDEHFQLIAIYSSMEEYKMAFFLNKYLKLKLTRDRMDIDFMHNLFNAVYPLYSFKNPATYLKFELVANKFKGKPVKVLRSGSLFREEEVSPQEVYLVPEYNKVDYFLKLSEEATTNEFLRMINSIGQIPGVQAAHAIDVDNLKSKQNLIFE